MAIYPEFVKLPTEQIRANLHAMSITELDDLLKDRYMSGLDWSNKKVAYAKMIQEKSEAMADAIKSNDIALSEQLSRDIDVLRENKAIAQRNCEIKHLEANCCYIVFIERGVLTPEQYPEIEERFPFDNFRDLDKFRVNNGYLEPQSGRY